MIDRLAAHRAIVILRTKAPPEITLAAARAVARGGIRFIEITLTSPGALEVVKALAAADLAFPGAGTVLHPDQVDAAVEAGARFIVTPVTLPDVVARARQRGIPIISGAATPGEIFSAHQAGADLIKVFPARFLGGPDYLRTVLGPLEGLKLVPTGGLRIEEAADYLRAGAFAVGVGLPTFDATHAVDELEVRARALVGLTAMASSRQPAVGTRP